MALAMVEDQRVYTLTNDNAYNLSQITIDSEARSEIQNAIQRGYEVTVHENPLNLNGWEGSGYAIIDPENGVGAYKISGGTSGGVLPFLTTLVIFAAFAAIISVGVLVALGGSFLAALGAAAAFGNFLLWTNAIGDAQSWEELNVTNLVTTLGLSLGVIGLLKLGIKAWPLIFAGEGFAFLFGLI